jgi:hypothetical protein
MHVSGIGQPFPSTPPGHIISFSLQWTGQKAGQSPFLDGMHESGILQPMWSSAPGQCISSGPQFTGQKAVHFDVASNGIQYPFDGHPLVLMS